MNRAYSVLDLKVLDDGGDKRVLEGIASTPTPDRMQDVVELDGIEFKLPIPLLYQHNAKQPIGNVIAAKVTKQGLYVKAQIASAGVAGFIDEAWSLIKAGLVRGFSIGFRSLEDAYNRDTGGYHFLRIELVELSAVTVPANAEATILTVKSADLETLAASGRQAVSPVRLTSTSPGVSGLPSRGNTLKTIPEQIVAFENKRASSVARMEAIMTKASDDTRTLDETEREEYDSLAGEVSAVDEHIARLKKHEQAMVAKATAITSTTAGTPAAAVATRTGTITVERNSNIPKGTAFTRMVGALVTCKGNRWEAAEYAKRRWSDSTPEVELVLRTAVEAGDTTTSGWASQLVPAAQAMQNEFIDLLRPATIIGRIPNLRRVPFNISVPIQTAGGTYGWVGEARGKPVTSLTFSSVTLRWAKCAGIVVITKELARFSSPSAETLVRNDMIAGAARFLDQQFVDPAVAEVTNVSPASITNGASATAATGTTSAAFKANMQTALGNFITNNQDVSSLVVLMSATVAMNLSLMLNALGQREYPDISVLGGTILGLPVIVSQNVGARIIIMNANEILIADDGGIEIDVSQEASVEMDTEPVVGDTSPITALGTLKSLWQNNLVGLRVERFITWKRARTSAVEYITNAVYSG